MSESPELPITARARNLTHAAKELDMSRRTLERHVACGRVRVIKIGRSVRIPVSEIERLLAGDARAE